MNLNKLFQIQSGLDYHIVKEKGLEGQDLLDKKILALQVELGELANEWRGFKFWSKNQSPQDFHLENGKLKNPLLEEYVDCMHFILSIGLNIGVKSYDPIKLISLTNDITGQFNTIFKLIGQWEKVFLFIDHDPYHVVVNEFLNLGEKLGFTWKQIEQAYLDKNKINHERQLNGY